MANFCTELYRNQIIKTWLRDQHEGWELTSGEWSPFYFAFRDVPSYPDLFEESIDHLLKTIESNCPDFDRIVGIASTGIPLAAVVASRLRVPMGFSRKVAGLRTVEDLKSHTRAWGGHAIVEGVFHGGDRLLLIDDVITGGASKDLAVALVNEEARQRDIDIAVVGIVVVVDRGTPKTRDLAVPVWPAVSLVDELKGFTEGGATEREVDVMLQYINDPVHFQVPAVRDRLIAEAKAVWSVKDNVPPIRGHSTD